MSLSQLLTKNHNLFISEIQQAANQLDNGSIIEIPQWQIEKQQDGSFWCDMQRLAAFRNVPEKGRQTDRSNKINVFVKGHMHAFKCTKTIFFKKYQTSVLYCRPTKPSDARTLKDPVGYHYDYDQKVSPAHPLFHAQQDNKLLKDDVAKELSINFEQITDNTTRTKNEGNDFRTVRIPTCQLDFYSTILMIIADHLVDHEEPTDIQVFHDLIQRCASYWLAPEKGDEDAYSKHLFTCPDKEFNSFNWYCFKK